MTTKKFNKSEILKKAWSLVKRGGYTLSQALKTAWQYARNGASVYKGDAERIFSSPVRKHAGLSALATTLGRGAAL